MGGQAERRSGEMCGLVAVGMWGLAPVATRALVADLDPLPLLVLRLVVASAVVLPWGLSLLRSLDRASLGRLTAAGLLGMVGYSLPVTVGIQWVPASTAALVLATEPIWILALSRVSRAESVSARSWLGAAVAFGGIAVLAGPLHGSGGRGLLGIALVMLGTGMFAAYTIVLRPLSRRHGPAAATAASTVVGSLPYLAFAGLVSPQHLASLHAASWGELAFLALGSTAAGMLLWNLAVVRLGNARAGLLLYLEPVVGVAGAAALLGERLTVRVALGGCLVLAGLALAWTRITQPAPVAPTPARRAGSVP